MKRISSIATLVTCLMVSTSTPSVAGNVLKVDPTNPAAYVDIQSAINAASSGDIIVVHPKPSIPGLSGSDLYSPFTIDKSIAITAEVGAIVKSREARIQNLVVGKQVLLRGIIFERINPAITSNLVVDNNQGAVWVEDCTFRMHPDAGGGSLLPYGIPPVAALPAVKFTHVPEAPGFGVFVRCTIEGSAGRTNLGSGACYGCQLDAGDGLEVSNGPVSIWDSTIRGGVGQQGAVVSGLPGGPGGDAILLNGYPGCHAFVSGSILAGGNGGEGNFVGGACVPGGNGGKAVVAAVVSSATMLETTWTGGAAGAAAGACASGQPGSAGVGVVGDLIGPSYSVFTESPKRQGQNLHLELTGPQLGYYLVDVGVTQKFVFNFPIQQGIGHIDVDLPPLHPLFLGQFQGPPEVIEFPLNGLLGGADGMVLYFQAKGIATYPGQEAYSAPSALVLLDASL